MVQYACISFYTLSEVIELIELSLLGNIQLTPL